MRRDQRGDAAGLDQGRQGAEDVVRGFRVEVAGGLVGEQQTRGVGDGPRYGDALLFAAGEFGGAVFSLEPSPR